MADVPKKRLWHDCTTDFGTASDAPKASEVQSLCEDDLDILLQDRLIKSARFWRVNVPSVSDKDSWGKFTYRTPRPKL
jgi:hypothetical protein